jgi:hypothetical protein
MMDDAAGMRGIGGRGVRGALRLPGFGEPVMHILRRVEPERDVSVLGVVPAKEVRVKMPPDSPWISA